MQYGDLPQFVDFALHRAGRAGERARRWPAARAHPARPRDVAIDARGADQRHDAARGSANTEPDLAGYEIVWRETTEPLWTHSRFVGNVTSYTVEDITKDNFHFGVRAVDRAGNRSTVRFPGSVLVE